MLYVVTVHFRSPAWIDVQRRFLERHLPRPFQVWGSLQGIEGDYASRFDRVVEQMGERNHPAKLNHLAAEICDVADPEDAMLFLDGDAFPIADLRPMLNARLPRVSLIAAQRAENLGDQQPHPLFCAVTVGEWVRLRGDWGAAATWQRHSDNKTVTDTGGNLLRRLEATGSTWEPLRRSNGHDLHPVFFGIYGDLVYHHGAAFRPGLSRLDRRLSRSRRVHLPGRRLSRAVNNRLAGRRYRQQVAVFRRRSAELYERIEQDDQAWLAELRGTAPCTIR
jgi:hypothetical protein